MSLTLNFKVPNWIEVDELEVIDVVAHSNSSEAIVLVGENLNESKLCRPTIRLYLAELVNKDFEIVKELDAFMFDCKEQALSFVKRLPNLSALELILEIKKYKSLFTF